MTGQRGEHQDEHPDEHPDEHQDEHRDAHRILLVEDNADDAELTVMALAATGLPTAMTVVADGQAALDHLFDLALCLPDLVILDLKLPKLDGLEVLRRIRAHERTRLQRVVMLTTSAEDSDLVGAFERGVNAYVRKPVDYDEFQRSVHHLGLFWLVDSLAPPSPGPQRRCVTP